MPAETHLRPQNVCVLMDENGKPITISRNVSSKTEQVLTFSAALKDGSGAVLTGGFPLMVLTPSPENKIETIYVKTLNAEATATATVNRGIPPNGTTVDGSGYPLGSSTYALADIPQGSVVGISMHAFLYKLIENAIQGVIGTGGNNFIVGDKTDTAKIIQSLFAAGARPMFKQQSDGTIEYYGADNAYHSLDTVGAHGSTASIGDHSNVDLTGLASGDVLMYNGTDFVAKTIGEILGNAGIGQYTYAEDAQASDTYVITVTPAPSAYADGQEFTFKANTANTGAATLNVNALGAKTIKKNNDRDLETGDIEAEQIVTVRYNLGDDVFELMSASAGAMTLANIALLTGGVASDADALHTHGTILSADDLFDVVASATNIYTDANNAATTSATYVKLKEKTLMVGGTYRIRFGVELNTNAASGYAQIYKNDVAFGTERNTSIQSETVYSEDLTFAAGDKVQIYAKKAGTITTVTISNFYIDGTLSIAPSAVVT